MLRKLLRIATYVGGPYLGLVLLIYLLQRRLLYFPDLRTPSVEGLRQLGLKFWPQPEDYRALVSIAGPHYAKGTVIVFHGNSSLAAGSAYHMRALEPLGYRVVLVEYPGYGGRNGKLSETEVVRDAKQTVRLACERFGGPVYVWGESLGTGVASAVAADTSLPIAGLVLITPFDSVSALAQTLYWFVPARWMVWDKFDSVDNLQSFTGPVAVLMAGQDSVVPKQHTMGLYDSLTGPKKLWYFENAGHTDWPTGSHESWWREVMDFVAAEEGNQEIYCKAAGCSALH
jgi:pimeloyl-ACP methyl ester carboxylesterase